MKKSLLLTVSAILIAGYAQSQLKVGNNPTLLNSSAMLEVEATDKGFLPPRVSLTATNVAAPIASPVPGLIVIATTNAGTPPNNVTANSMYMWDGTHWDKIVTSSSQISDTSGSETKKIQHVGLNDATKTVINGPFEFRTTGTANQFNYEFRLVEQPSANVVAYCANANSICNGNNVQGTDFVRTFTTANWNTWQIISTVTTSTCVHMGVISIDSQNIPSWTNSKVFYSYYAQKIDGATGLKSFIITRY